MKILWVGHNLAYPPKGGVLQRNYNLLRQAAKSCEVHVLAFDQPATRPPGVNPEDCIHALQRFCKTVEAVRLPVGPLNVDRYWQACKGLMSSDPYAVQWLRSDKMVGKLRKILDYTRFDVVHFDTLGLAQYRPFVTQSATVLNHHNVESSMMERRARNARNMFVRHYFRKEAQKLRKAEQHWCPKFGVNLVVSREEEQLLERSIPEVRTAVVANGVDTDYFTPRSDPGGETLLFCGALNWYPNLQAMKFFFDRIWPGVAHRMRNVKIYVVGAKPPRWLQRLSASDHRIYAPGFVEDVRPYFRRATAYVCPITDGGGTRLKILDALAMGVPLVGTSFACSGLALKHGKHVLLAETPEDFVCELEQVLSNSTLRISLSMAGREIVERMYSWSVIGRSLIEAYETASRTRSAAKG